MRPLPTYLRRLPYVFYVLALLLGGWRFYNEYTTAAMSMQYAVDDVSGLLDLTKSTALYWAATEALYIIGTGALVHVLIAIHDRLSGASE